MLLGNSSHIKEGDTSTPLTVDLPILNNSYCVVLYDLTPSPQPRFQIRTGRPSDTGEFHCKSHKGRTKSTSRKFVYFELPVQIIFWGDIDTFSNDESH